MNTTPPDATASFARRSAREAACTGGWRSKSLHRAKVPKSWSSRSLRSVRTTTVGFSIAGWAMICPADAAVARFAARAASGFVASSLVADLALKLRSTQCLGDSGLDGVELVVAGDLLGQCAAIVLENDEVAEHREETGFLEHTLDQYLKPGVEDRRELLAADRAPRLEPLVARCERADPRLEAIRNHENGIAGEQRRQFRLVGLQLVVRRTHRGSFVRRVLEFDDREWQAVDEDDDVRAARVLVLLNGELVDREPVVRFGFVEVQDTNLPSPNVP